MSDNRKAGEPAVERDQLPCPPQADAGAFATVAREGEKPEIAVESERDQRAEEAPLLPGQVLSEADQRTQPAIQIAGPVSWIVANLIRQDDLRTLGRRPSTGPVFPFVGREDLLEEIDAVIRRAGFRSRGTGVFP